MRDCSRVRKVCDSTTGRPPSDRRRLMPSGLRLARLASNGTSGLRPISRSMPRSSTHRGMHRAAQRAIDEMAAADVDRRDTGRAGRRWPAPPCEIGTSSQPSPPKRTASPLSSSTATTYSGAASSRKSLLRPRRVNTSRRKCSISRAVEQPGRHQPAEAGDQVRPARIAAARTAGRATIPRPGAAGWRRGAGIRRRPGAGRSRGGTARRRCRR